MPTTTRSSSAGDDPVLLLLFVGWLALEAAATALITLVALVITLASPRRPAAPQPPLEQPVPLPAVITAALPPVPAAPSLEALPVAQLRRMAREAGLPRRLSHSGRKAELLLALA